MKCCTCGKTIQHPYYLNGKRYGYNCYKVALAQWKLEKQQLLNDEYAAKVAKYMQIYRHKEFTKQYSKDFQKSLVEQYEACGKLTAKQLQCIKKSFNTLDKLQLKLLEFEMVPGEEYLKDENGEFIYFKSGRKKRNIDKLKAADHVAIAFRILCDKDFKKAESLLKTSLLKNTSFVTAMRYSYEEDIENEKIYVLQSKEFNHFHFAVESDYKEDEYYQEDYKLIEAI